MSKKIDLNSKELAPEVLEAEKKRRKSRAVRRKVGRVIDRIFGFVLATCIVFGLSGLALEYVLIKGPSPALKETFVNTMLETRRFRFIPNIFLSEEEVSEIQAGREQDKSIEFDSSLINLPSQDQTGEEGETTTQESKYPPDEDGDGIIFEEIKGAGYVGYMITVLDPKRVFIGMPDFYGGSGLSVEDYCLKYDAIGGINGGGFYDDGGGGLGGNPDGLTIIDGVVYNEGNGGGDAFVGFNEDGIMYVGYYTLQDAQALGIVSGVTFGPILVQNGEGLDVASSVNPRTAIGQRDDGAVLMLVIDGRQTHSAGAMYQDLTDIMLDHGAVNAINLDGGSSTSMWMNGEYVNSCSSASGFSRNLPNAFMFK